MRASHIRTKLYGINKEELIQTRKNLALAMYDVGEYWKAIENLEIAADFQKEIYHSDDIRIVKTYRIIGKIYTDKLKDPETALDYYKANLEILFGQQLTDVVPEIGKTLA